MFEQDQVYGLHGIQSLFIKNQYSESQQCIKNKNLMKDESCWSESERRVEINSQSKVQFQNVFDQQIENQEIDQQLVDITHQSNKSNFRIQQQQQSALLFSQRTRNMSRHQYILSNYNDELSQRSENVDAQFLNQTGRQQYYLESENQFYSQFKKNQQQINQNNEQLQLLKKNLVFITKMKIRMSNFYKLLTNIVRNRSYNKKNRLLINDLSDNIPNITHQFQDNILLKRQLWDYIYNLPLIDIQNKFIFDMIPLIISFVIEMNGLDFLILKCLYVIGLILAEMAKQQENQTRDIRTINEYMQQRNISNNLKAKVNQNLLHYYQKNFKQQQIENEQVLCRLSGELKDSLFLEYNMKILSKIPFLQRNFSQQTLNQISLCLKEDYYFPNQIIQFEKDIQNQSLMIIIEGQVEIDLYPNSQRSKQQNSIQLLNPGDIFGQFSFFTGQAQQFSTKSTDFTKIMRLDRQDFIEIVKKNDSEHQKYCEIKDKILFQNGFINVDLKCQICHSNLHSYLNCTNVGLNKKGIFLKIKILESDIQKRQQFKRKISHTSTPLLLLKYQSTISKLLQQKLEIERQISEQSQSEISSSSDSLQENQQEEMISNLQNTIKRQSETLKIDSDLNTQQFIEKLNHFKRNSQYIKFSTHELEEIILLADSSKPSKLEREENNQATQSNLENKLSDQNIKDSVIFENNNQESDFQGQLISNSSL
ncbi:hypothetical protein ABPG74_010844 [Tetrahymena malaccensis]